jgi:hypothetical protein
MNSRIPKIQQGSPEDPPVKKTKDPPYKKKTARRLVIF